MKRCNEPHPESAEPCIQPEGVHLDHVARGGISWPNAAARQARARAPQRRSGARGGSKASPDALNKIRTIAGGARPESRVNSHRPPTHGPSPAAREDWDRSAWAEQVTQTLSDFLSTRAEPFTTPEHLWPLIDSPNGDMRAMSVVVQTALRADLMEEVGGKRLRDTYRTRDGVEFAMNKIVPVYRSKIVGAPLE